MAKLNIMQRALQLDDLARSIKIHICKDGTISYRRNKEPVLNGVALVVFSVDTEQQARDLQIRFGRCQYTEHPDQPGRPWYRWTDFSGSVKDLDAITLKCREFYDKAKRGT